MVFSLIPAPYRLVAGAVAAAVVLGAVWGHGYWRGRDGANRAWEESFRESVTRAVEQANAIAKQDAEVSEYFEKWRTRYVTEYENVNVTEHIPPDCNRCVINPVGLGLLNNARRADVSESTPSTGKFDYSLPRPPSSNHWLLPRNQPEPPANDRSVPNMSGETPATDRTRKGPI
jgi:hypothetical protein